MKKFLLLAMMAVSAMTANAQVWVGGAVGYDYNDLNGQGFSKITLSPEVGYNLDDKWAIALDLNTSFRVGDGSDNTEFTLTPYARYTFFRSGIASLFVDGGFSVGADKEEGQDANAIWGVGLRPGIAISITPQLTFVTKLAYFGYEKNDKEKRDSFGFGIDNDNLKIGLYYSF